jgi:hypothetical protein
MFAATDNAILRHLLPCNEGRSVNPLRFSAWWFLYIPPGSTLKNFIHSARRVHLFCLDLRTNSDYFSREIFFLITETECVYCAVRTESLPVI